MPGRAGAIGNKAGSGRRRRYGFGRKCLKNRSFLYVVNPRLVPHAAREAGHAGEVPAKGEGVVRAVVGAVFRDRIENGVVPVAYLVAAAKSPPEPTGRRLLADLLENGKRSGQGGETS